MDRRVSVVLALALGAGTLGAGGPGTASAAVAGPALTVDVSADRHAISPDIYGMNFADPALATELRLPVDRWGGNSATRYNYQNNLTNSAQDWYYLVHSEDTSADEFVARDHAAGAKTVITVPMIGRVTTGAAGSCSFSIAKYGAQQDAGDAWHPDCGNGRHIDGSNVTGNDPADTTSAETPDFVTGMVQHLVAQHGDAAHGGVGIYQLDNEPVLWNSTHRDIHPDPLTYDELWSRTAAYGAAVKAADPTAATLGPSDWGWCAYFGSAADSCTDGSDRQAHSGTALGEWYLQQARAYEQAHGTRLLDYFDEHFYPQASGVALSPAGDAATQALRLRSTRALWDPSYRDESWISDTTTEAVALLPRFHSWIDRSYPGTKLALTEYNFGGLESMNGALAQADVLGIFARERVDLATLWAPPSPDQPGAFAFRLMRSYDGHGAGFGDTWVRSTSADQGRLAVYGAQRGAGGAVTVLVVNKTGSDLSTSLAVRGTSVLPAAQVWRYSAASPNAIVRAADATVTGGTVATTFPASSLTMLVLTPGPDPIAAHYAAVGGAARLGTPVGGHYAVPGGVAQNYTAGRIYYSSATGAREVHGAILARYLAVGGPGGVLGLPASDERAAAAPGGRLTAFQRGEVAWTPATGAHEVHGTILVRWQALGAERGRLRFPTSDEYAVAGGRESAFQGGWVRWTAATRALSVRYR